MLVGVLWSNLMAVSEVFEKADIKSLQLVRCKLEEKVVVGINIPINLVKVVKEMLYDMVIHDVI